MPEHTTEKIHHYNKLLIQQHRFVGGAVLREEGLRTRIFKWADTETGIRYAWGADYAPSAGNFRWLDKLMVGEGYDAELGLPGTGICESWLSIARGDDETTAVTQYEYGTSLRRYHPPFVAVAEQTLPVPSRDISLDHVRGGLGYWRGALERPVVTRELIHAEQLAAALQATASYAIAHSNA